MEFNSSTGYKIIKQEINCFLREFNFKPFKASTIYKVTSDDILQFICFQKGERSLNQQLTINVVLQAMFAPACSFNILEPGGRIGKFINFQTDTWWPCDTEKAVAISMGEIKNALTRYLLPFFEKTATVQGVCNLIEAEAFSFIWSNPATFINKGFFYLKAGQYYKAINIFESNGPGKVSKFKTIKRLVEMNKYNDVQNILTENTKFSKTRLGI